MRVHQQHYSFQNVYKKIKSQFNNTCVCSDRTKQIKHESPAKFMFINGYRDGSATGLIQNLAANIWKQEKRKKNSSLEKCSKLNNIYNRDANFRQLIYCTVIAHKNKHVSILFLAWWILQSSQSGKNVSSERLLICRSDKQTIKYTTTCKWRLSWPGHKDDGILYPDEYLSFHSNL